MKLKQILAKPAVEAAPQLLGWILCRQLPAGIVKLKIVEVEAYNQDDSASHSFRGITTRTAPMFEAGGRLYVYFTYGMHYAINIVTGPAGRGEAVLLRAAEPLQGIEIMQQNRKITDTKKLANGPAKLAQALGIKDTKLSGKILNKSSSFTPKNKFSGDPGIYLEAPDKPLKPQDIIASPRIGISKAKDLPWRFYIKDCQFVSKL